MKLGDAYEDMSVSAHAGKAPPTKRLTREEREGLRKTAEDLYRMSPYDVLALLDRIEELEEGVRRLAVNRHRASVEKIARELLEESDE